MTAAPARWLLLEPEPATVQRLCEATDDDLLLARLLAIRGVSDVAQARVFLDPPLSSLPDPLRMKGALAGAQRLAAAVERGEQVCIYGDYDVDGVSASALMASFLRRLGLHPRVFLPDRFVDGYGLSAERLAELCDQGVQLFVSVDCGTRAVAQVAQVRARGVDFIVCDHHTPGPELPAATALLNPRQPGCTYPDGQLAAVGVALVLAQATRRLLGERGFFEGRSPPPMSDLLQYAALGTIADMVQLQGVNRLLAVHGLRRLGSSLLPGVVALARRSRIDTVRDADHVGFALGPRINAAGRVADATTAYTLLTTLDPSVADELADRVERENDRRRALQAEVEAQAQALADDQPGREHAVVVAAEGWHPGVVGIVAARIKDRLGVPALVLAIEAGGVARGSGRSVSGYDLIAGLHALAEADAGLLTRFGGHAFAAGVTLQAQQIGALRAALVEHVAAHWPQAQRTREVRIDAELTLQALDLALVDRISRLEPFGKGNPRPAFLLRGVVVAGLRRVGETAAWAKLRLVERSDRPMWARRGVDAFGPAAALEGVQSGDEVDVVCRLERNTFRERTSLQATVMHVAPPGQMLPTAQ